MLVAILGAAPLLAYWYGGWGWGWWWLVAFFFFIWLIFLPPFGWGSRWYGTRTRVRRGAPVVTPEWESVESRFVEAPNDAVADADRIVTNLLPSEGGGLLDYRAAHEVAEKAKRGEANDRELRSAMRTFRSMYLRLVSV